MRKLVAATAAVLAVTSFTVHAQEPPRLELDRSAASPTDTVTVQGFGFQQGNVGIHLDLVASPPLATIEVGRDGTFAVLIVVPVTSPGRHRILACRDLARDGTCREFAEAVLDIVDPAATTTSTRPPDVTTTAPHAPETTARPTPTTDVTVASEPPQPPRTPEATEAPSARAEPPVAVATTTTMHPPTGNLAVSTSTTTTSPIEAQQGTATTTTSPIGDVVGGTPTTLGDPPFDPNPQVLVGQTTTLPPVYQPPMVEGEHDVELTHIEVTQGLQNLDNEFPLVADRPTAVRVFGLSHGDQLTLASAWLQVSRDGEVLGIVEAENNPVQFTDHLVRSSNDHAPYFLLDPSWIEGTLDLLAVATVGDPSLANDSNPSDNFIATSVTFHEAEPVTVHMFPLYLTDDGTSGGGTPVIYSAADGWLQQAIATYRLWPVGTMTFDPFNPVVGNSDSGWDLTEDGSLTDPFPALALVHESNDYGPFEFTLGMVSPSVPSEFGGGAQKPGSVSWAKMSDVWSAEWPWHYRAGGVIAQELGHNAGLSHAPCDWNVGDPEPGEVHGGSIDPLFPQSYAWPNCSIGPNDIEGYYGFDVQYALTPTTEPSIMSNNPAASPPLNATPFMGYAGTGKWIEPWHGCQLLDFLGVECTPTDLIPIDDDTPGQGQGLPPIGDAQPVWTCEQWDGQLPGDGDLCDLAPTKPFDPTALEGADEDLLILATIDPEAGTATLAPGAVLSPKVANAVRALSEDKDPDQSTSSGPPPRHHVDTREMRWALADHGDIDYLLLMLDDEGGLLGAQTLDAGHTAGDRTTDTAPGHGPSDDTGDPAHSVDHHHALAHVAVRVPNLAGLHSVVIVAESGELARLEPGDAAPVVDHLDVSLTGNVAQLDWKTLDADGDAVSTIIQYGSGGTWTTVATPPAGSSTAAVDLAPLPGGAGELRLLVADGINQTEARSELLELPDRAPFASIVSPRDGHSRPAGRLVELRGSTIDPEDRAAMTITWTSDRDGELGQGDVLGVTDLSQGTHRITMSVVDSAGNRSEDSIDMIVGPSDLSPPEAADAVAEVLAAGVGGLDLGGESDRWAGWLLVGLVGALTISGALFVLVVRDRRSTPPRDGQGGSGGGVGARQPGLSAEPTRRNETAYRRCRSCFISVFGVRDEGLDGAQHGGRRHRNSWRCDMFGRSRWAAVGAIVAVLVGGGSVLTASAAGSPSASSFVPITPCRLFDTRAGADNIGPRSAPLGPNETHIAQVWGSNGNCTIPTGATGVSLGVTIVNPTSPSFLTVFPADATRPLASNLNWVAGQAPTPNAVTAPLSADGRMGLYNLAGTVDVLVDIVGYYELATSGPTGPPGPKGDPGLSGPKGDTGDPGPRPAQVVWVAKSGGDFTSVKAALASITDNGSAQPYVIKIAPGVYAEPGGLDLKDYVDIEGSGQDITTITCACGSTTDPGTNGSSATLRASGPSLHSEVRDLTISNTGGNTHSTGVRTSQVLDQVALRDLTITASGAASSWGVVTVVSSSPIIADVTAAATGSNSASGVVNLDSSPTMTDVTAAGTAAGARGVWNLTDASPTMTDVIATATSTVGLASAVQNEAGASPTMTDVIATATSDSSVARGVFNIASSPTMTGGSATGRGASAGIGIHNSNGGSPTFNTVTATGTGSGPVRGMVNESSASATLVNVTARGSGTLNQDVGIENLTNATMTVRDSFVTGTQISILNNGSTVRVANTRLSTVAQGAMTCINSYLSDTFALLNASCQ